MKESDDTPVVCPFCDYAYKMEDQTTVCRAIKEPNTFALKDMAKVDWQCPGCKQWVTPEDEEEKE